MAKTHIYISNGKAYVWSVQDVAVLRTKHRICGTLAGTLPHLAQQNFFLGLPLILMPEEVVLLVDNEDATLIDDSTAMREPSTAELAKWDEDRRSEITHQIKLWHERESARVALETTNPKGKGKGKGKMNEAAVQKRKEREEQRKRDAEAAMNKNAVLPGPATSVLQSEHLEQPQTRATYTLRIPSASASSSWYQPSSYDDILSAKDAGIWTYPHDQAEHASCRVFRYLWEKGYYLGSGIKFGGEFLVYPGDPLRYHSHFVASVLPSTTSTLRPIEIVAHGRLVTATKKAHLLCGWDEDKQEVACFSIEWAGFG